MDKTRNIIVNVVIVTIPSLLLFLLILEAFFTWILPATNSPQSYFDETDNIFRFEIKENYTGIYTIGALAQERAKWIINNYGWNSEINYSQERKKPLIAVIGDSYIEAFQVDINKSYPGLLRKRINNYNVYSFGISGAPLSQYLHISRYVNKYFDPQIIIFNVVHNDFDESISDVKFTPKFLQYYQKDDDWHEAPITPYVSSSAKRILRKSALVRYFYWNLHFASVWKKLFSIRSEKEIYNANIKVNKVLCLKKEITSVTDFILNIIKQENKNRIIVFVMDAPRNDIYNKTLNKSNVILLNNILKTACEKYDFTFIDMTKYFNNNWKINGKHFESPYDGHWNEYGHKVVADTICENLDID